MWNTLECVGLDTRTRVESGTYPKIMTLHFCVFVSFLTELASPLDEHAPLALNGTEAIDCSAAKRRSESFTQV